MSADRHDQPRPDDVIGAVGTPSGTYPLHADGTFGEGQERVTAVIYDRLATPSRAYLDVRLEACREYAAERGWRVAAECVDIGDDALHDRVRPGLDAALKEVEKAADKPVTDRAVLLVYNHGRLSHDAMNLAFWLYRVSGGGGVVVTATHADQPGRGGADGAAAHRVREVGL